MSMRISSFLRRSRAASIALLWLSAPSLAPAQTPKTVTLPASGITFEIPGNWVARQTPFQASSGPPVDLVTRLEPQSAPLLFFTVVVVGGHTCAEWAMHQAQSGGKVVRNPAYVPPAFYPLAIETPASNGGTMSDICGDLPRAVLLVNASYGTKEKPRPFSDPDAQFLTPVLASLARGAGVSPKTAPAAATRAMLTTLRTEIELPPSWASNGGGGIDKMKRTTPPLAGAMFSSLGPICDGGPCSCEEWDRNVRTMPNVRMVTRPSYWVNGYYPNVDERIAAGQVTATFCYDGPDGAVIVGTAAPSVTDPTLLEVKLVLSRAIAARTQQPIQAMPAPPPPPPPAPPSTPAESPPPAKEQPLDEPPPPYSPPSEPSQPPPAYDSGSRSDDDSDYSVSPFVNPHRIELLIQRVESTTPNFDLSITGAGFRLDGVRTDPEESLSFMMRYGVTFGYFDDSSIALDGDFGAGLALRIATPFTIIPVLGVGGDSLSGGDGGFDMGFDFYWYPQLMLQLDLGVGIEASVARLSRGGDSVAKETRVVARMLFGGDDSRWALGFDYRTYDENARSLGGSLGRTF
jgi:hypothetical protein